MILHFNLLKCFGAIFCWCYCLRLVASVSMLWTQKDLVPEQLRMRLIGILFSLRKYLVLNWNILIYLVRHKCSSKFITYQFSIYQFGKKNESFLKMIIHSLINVYQIFKDPYWFGGLRNIPKKLNCLTFLCLKSWWK